MELDFSIEGDKISAGPKIDLTLTMLLRMSYRDKHKSNNPMKHTATIPY